MTIALIYSSWLIHPDRTSLCILENWFRGGQLPKFPATPGFDATFPPETAMYIEFDSLQIQIQVFEVHSLQYRE
jgi:hypothetical protein